MGARKERANQTHDEVTKILVRNLVANDRVLTVAEINRILHTKSIENKIRVKDLPDEISFVYALYTRVAEDEMLPPENRKELLLRINKYLEEVEKEAPSIIEAEEEPVEREEELFDRSSFVLAVISTVLATISSFVVSFIGTREITFPSPLTIVGTVAGIATVISVIYAFLRLKEKQEEPAVSRRSFIREYWDFEGRISKILSKLGNVKREAPLGSKDRRVRFDFLLVKGGKTFLVEAKWFRRYASKFMIESMKSMARTAKEIDKTYSLILVVNDKKFVASGLSELRRTWDYIFDERELRGFRAD